LLLAIAAQGLFLAPSRAQNSLTNVTVVSIRASVAETREPFCDPAICDAALPAPGVFVVTRRGGDLNRELAVSLGYAGTATSESDYAALPEFALFRAGQASVELLVEATFDRLSEGDEIVIAQVLPDPTLGPIERYRVDPAQAAARVVIHDNEAPPVSVVSIEATSPIAEESSFPYRRLAFRGRFTIRRTGSTSHALPVFVHYSGSATPGVDYPFLPWLVDIPAGTNQIEIDVAPNPDDVPEPIETLVATLSECPPLTDPPLGIPCYQVNIDPAKSQATVFIRDDGLTTASLDITSPRNGETFSLGVPIPIAATALDLEGAITRVGFFDGDMRIGESIITFIREPDPGTPIFHEFEWRGATAGAHVLTARAVNAAGNAVTSAPVRMSVGGGLPVVSIEATVPETTEPSPTTRIRPGAFTLRRTGGTGGDALRVWVRYSGTATSGADYEAPPNVVEFPAGAASVEVLIVPFDDDLVEGDETVVAELTPSPLGIPPQYVIDPAASRARVIIHDNDGPVVPVVSIRATQPFTAEPCPVCLIAPGVFTISRTGSTQNGLFVQLAARGTATPGEDYHALPASVEIPAGRESVELLVLPKDDLLVEGDETVIAVLLPDPSLGPIERYRVDPEHSQDTVIIRDDDSPLTPVVSIRATRPETHEPVCPPDTCAAPTPAPGVFTVSRRGGDRSHALTVLLRYGGSALPRADYDPLPESVTIPAGLESVELYVNARFDELAEGDESVVASLLPDPSLGPLERYRIDPAQATARVVIHDNTPPALPVVSIVATDPFAREGAHHSTGLNTATFVVSRAGPTNDPLRVLFDLGGTAVNGTDYEAVTRPLVIPAGQRHARLLIRPIDDNRPEPIETVVVTLLPNDASDPGYALARPQRAAAIIVDNDHLRPPCLRLPDGLFNVCVPVAAIDCFRVEVTRDFKEWTPLCVVPVNEGAAHFVDPDAPDSPRRFYRLVPVACDAEE
jgi:hypothetical protein